MSDSSPQVSPEQGWVPVSPFPPGGSAKRSFVSGSGGGGRMRVSYYRRPAHDHLFALAWFGPQTEGPPNRVHGGAIAALLDEAMGAVCWMNEHPVVGARIMINYLHMVPLGFDGRVDAWIDAVDRRKLTTRARLTDGSGKIYAEGEGLFIELRPQALAELRA